MAHLPQPWWIGLAGWVLAAGYERDFATGEQRRFALELGYDRADRLRPATDRERACRHTGHGVTYDVTGQVLRSAAQPMRDAVVLDVGLSAYTEWLVLDDLEPPQAGSWLTGRISLHVDYFAYADELARLPGMPPLIHTWTIDEIQVDRSGADEWCTVDRTRRDDPGSYRLRCTLEDVPPTRTAS